MAKNKEYSIAAGIEEIPAAYCFNRGILALAFYHNGKS